MRFTPLVLVCALAAAGLATAGCDSAPDVPPAFTVQAVADGVVVGEAEVFPAPLLAPSTEVSVAPIRTAPNDPALAERFRLSQATAAVVSAASGEPHSAGYYLVRVEPTGADIGFAPASCASEETCLFVVPNDGRVPRNGETGAVFFPVPDASGVGPPLALRPFGLGGAGRLVFEGGNSDRTTVDVPSVDAPPVALDRASRADLVRVVRGASDTATLLAIWRVGKTRVGVLEAGQRLAEVEAPGGTGDVAVFLLGVE